MAHGRTDFVTPYGVSRYVLDQSAVGAVIVSQVLTEDSKRRDSSHDFGKDIIPYIVKNDFGGTAAAFGLVMAVGHARPARARPEPRGTRLPG